MTHICVSKLTNIGSDNVLSPDRRQAIIWTNAGILLIGLLGTNFNEMLIEIHAFSFTKIHLKMSSGKWRPFCLGLNMLTRQPSTDVFSMVYQHHMSPVLSTGLLSIGLCLIHMPQKKLINVTLNWYKLWRLTLLNITIKLHLRLSTTLLANAKSSCFLVHKVKSKMKSIK